MTEEEKKQRKKEQARKYYLKNKEKLKEQRRDRYQANKEKELECIRKYTEKHKEEIARYQKEYSEKNNDRLKAYKSDYYKKMHGRSLRLSGHYMAEDKKHNRGESTLTPEWIIENIFSKPCHYCGESNWLKIGCDRKNSDLPHTPDNVVPCCFDCNRKKGSMSYEEYMKKVRSFS